MLKGEKMSTSRRTFIKALAGSSAFAIGGCKSIFGFQKIKLAAVGLTNKGYTDWTPMLRSGLVEIVAFCDADRSKYEMAMARAKKDGFKEDLAKVPFYTDYRKMFDDADFLGIEAMTVSTPDHAHGAIAIEAMKRGIHVFVQKPLVRTMWELDYFEKTAKENGVITQMGNQASALDSLRRATEVLRSGILGDVSEIHIWTNRPVWPQGKQVDNYIKSRKTGDVIPAGLDWNAWLGTAAERPFLDCYPKGMKIHDPWNMVKNVYHPGAWRGHFDFGCGALGDMACHMMNVPFRGLELYGATQAEQIKADSTGGLAYPLNSVVKVVYPRRKSKVTPGKEFSALDLYWYENEFRPDPERLYKWSSTHGGKIPKTGCYIKGSKGDIIVLDDHGGKIAISLNGEKGFKDIFEHEACKALAVEIPRCKILPSAKAADENSMEMRGFAEEHYVEFLTAIRGEGPFYKDVNSRCFSDVEFSVPQMEGILVGCMAQWVGGKVLWDSAKQKFDRADANNLLKPYIRKGWEF